MGVGHYENFPVASVLCPPSLRPPIVAIYRFARTADDLADEGDAPAAQRLADLAAMRAELRAAAAGRPPGPRWPEVFGPLARQIQAFSLPEERLAELLDAFEQDVRNPPYADRAAVLDYCRRSANPIGRLLLHLYGVDDPTALRRSDAICTALQLINFWQDLGVDAARDRVYVPRDELSAAGLDVEDLKRRVDGAVSRALVARLCDWAGALLHEGAPLAFQLHGRAGWELRLVVQGGQRVLEKIRRLGHGTLAARPALGAADVPVLLWRSLVAPVPR